MNDLEKELSGHFRTDGERAAPHFRLADIISGNPIAATRPTLAERRRGRERILVRVAAVALLLGGVGGIFAVAQHQGAAPATSVPPPTASDDVPAPTQGLSVVENQDVPEEQLAYFQDGKVTLQEYQEAYGAFGQCAADAGVGDGLREQSRDEVTGLIEYTTRTLLLPPGSSDGTKLNDCYQRWFAHVEVAFQISDPAVLAAEPQEQLDFFDENYRPCLDQIGVAVPDDLEFQDENWGPLNDEAVRAIQDGRCVLA